MATQFKNKVINQVGLLNIIALETDASTKSTIIGINIANLTESIIAANVLVKADDSALGYFMKGIMVPPNSSLKVLSAGEKLILAPNNQLQFSADQDEALDVIISYVDIV
jgi:hypothetical protein|tara:strand:- start:144 stop:473 length:330 start_codon:yes stop_codon:yes gene_type:complete